MASTIANHTLPLLPSVRQPKFLWVPLRFSFYVWVTLWFALRWHPHNCFASLFFGRCQMFCGQIKEKRNSQPSSKENTNWCITKCMFYMLYISIYHLGFSIFQNMNFTKDSEEQLNINQRTERTRKVQVQSSHSVISNSFSTCFHALTIGLS